MAVLLIAFANADGGTAAIGVENDGRITGVDGMQEHINELLRAGFDFCVPSILTTHEYREVTDFKGQKNHIILMRVAPSMKVHANQADEVFTGPVLKMTDDVLTFVKTQVKEHTYLGADGLFKTDPQYPEFCWTELCVNSICHRDYSILGTDIQVKIFDDHITVESPGIFPGLVRPANIRHTHFSRNPKIAAYMHEYKLVKEYGEGVDRMYRELEEAGNPAPEFKQQDFMVLATIRQHKNAVVQGVSEDTSKDTSKGTSRGQVRGQVARLLETLKDDEMSVRELMDKFDFKSRDKFLANYLTPALEAGYVEMTQPDSPKSPTQKYRLSEAGRKVMDGAK